MVKQWERGGETEGENKKIYSKALKAYAANNLQILIKQRLEKLENKVDPI